MSTHTLRGPARRIAIVEVPRGAANRLGRIGTIRDIDWSTIPSIAPLSNEPWMPAQPYDATGGQSKAPPTSAQWMAQIVQRQSDRRESTPGTLTYTPSPNAQPATVARWNSWAGPCLQANGTAPSSTIDDSGAASCGAMARLFYVAAALAGAASAAYLLNTLMDGRK